MFSFIIAFLAVLVLITVITIGCFVEDYKAAKQGKKADLWEKRK